MGEMVNFGSKGGEWDGYLAKSQEGAPAVLVIQNWWGLVDHIKDVCERFAGEGFTALAPDLYHGETTEEPDEAGKLLIVLDTDRAVTEMSRAVAYLRGNGASKVGCVGFGMGGALSLVVATRSSIDVSVIYYGLPSPSTGADDYSKLQGPVLGHFAEHDDWESPTTPAEVFDLIHAGGQSAEMHVYEGTQHAFFNDSRPDVYDADAAAKSWERTIEFFRAHLGSGGSGG